MGVQFHAYITFYSNEYEWSFAGFIPLVDNYTGIVNVWLKANSGSISIHIWVRLEQASLSGV